MDREARRQFEAFRRESGTVENQVIDDLLSGEVDRREFLRRGTMFGLSVSSLALALRAAGEAPVAFAATPPKRRGGRLRLGIIPPSGPIEPHMMTAGAGIIPGITGEYLIRAKADLTLAPQLAVAWKPNGDASQWTVTLRSNVKFQSGQDLAVEDVVTTYRRLTNPASGSQAISAFRGVLTPDGVQKGPTADTVIFDLVAPNASFPYILSSTTRQAIILPSAYQLGSFVSRDQTTGAFRLTSYTPGVRVTYERFDRWWGGRTWLDGVDAIIYADPSAATVGLLGNQVDALADVTLSGNRAAFENPNITIIPAKSAAHTEIPMRVDQAPFRDWRVRQAIALTIDRPALIRALYGKWADPGNDNPFAPVYPATVKVAQRARDIRKAKELMAAAGRRNGFRVTVTAEQVGAIPQMAQILQASAKLIGVNMNIQVEPDSVFFAGTPQTTHWLNNIMTMTGWGSRAVPNVFLTSAFQTGGPWNAAHYSSKAYDALAKSFVGAIALADQRRYAQRIENLLLHDTPVIIPAFTQITAAANKNILGIEPAQGAVWVSQVGFKA